MTQQNSQRSSVGFALGLATVFLLAGGGSAWWVLNHNNSPNPQVVESGGTGSQAQNPVQNDRVQLYWLRSENNSLALAPAPAQVTAAADTPEAMLTAGLNRLLEGPANADDTSTIPPGTKLNSLKIQPDGIYVDLSQEFTQGGGSTSMQGRLGQVLYTATSLDPNAKVWFSVAGEPLKVLGGEGILVTQPMTRQEFEANFKL